MVIWTGKQHKTTIWTMGFFRNIFGNVLFSDREFLSRDESWNEKHEKKPTARWTFFAVVHTAAEGISVSKWTVEEVEDLERSESPVDSVPEGPVMGKPLGKWRVSWENHRKTIGKWRFTQAGYGKTVCELEAMAQSKVRGFSQLHSMVDFSSLLCKKSPKTG